MGDIVPREKLVKDGLKGFGAVGGGLGLLILKAISSIPIVGIVAGGIVAIAGIAIGTSKEDRNAGLITVGAGVLTAISSFIPGFRWLMSVAGWGLVIAGGITLIRFFRNLKKRV